MKRQLHLAVILMLAAPPVIACMRSEAPPQRSPRPVPTPVPLLPKPFDGPLTGSEHVVWEQPVGAGTKAADYTFFVYIDGAKQPLPNVECHLLQGSRHHVCEAPVPALAPGRHTLRFSAARTVDGHEKISALSEPLVVVRASPGS